MFLLERFNLVSALLFCVFAAPLLEGALRPLDEGRLRRSLSTVVRLLELLLAIGLSLRLAGRLFPKTGESPLAKIVPSFAEYASGRDILAYAVAFATLLLVSSGLLRLLTIPVYRYVVAPLARKLALPAASLSRTAARLIGGACRLPGAAALVLLVSLLLNFYINFDNNAAMVGYIGESYAYRLVENAALRPILNTRLAKSLPETLDASIVEAVNSLSQEGRSFWIRTYYNGMTLEGAIESSPDIDALALLVVGGETEDRAKAFLLYTWVCDNIAYDSDKAVAVFAGSAGVASGAENAFRQRDGVCFDFSCLYVAMCRATDVKVRLLTGLGFDGEQWNGHAWNQIYCSSEESWIDVDTTFGSTGADYFGREDFNMDHIYGVVEGEW